MDTTEILTSELGKHLKKEIDNAVTKFVIQQITMKEILGKLLTDININDAKTEVTFTFNDGTQYKMYHVQDCCESVWLEDIDGDIKDLLNCPLLMADASSNKGDDNNYESSTWTFYKFATIKGFVTLRWLGTSNGYYSESVSFEPMK